MIFKSKSKFSFCLSSGNFAQFGNITSVVPTPIKFVIQLLSRMDGYRYSREVFKYEKVIELYQRERDGPNLRFFRIRKFR